MFNKKKKFFKSKVNQVQYTIWDMEFKREKSLMIRESIRKDYDGALSKLSLIQSQIKSLPEDRAKWTDEQKRLDDEVVRLKRDIEGEVDGQGTKTRNGYKDVLKNIDLEVHGSKKTNEFPDGVEGIDQQINGLRELLEMYKAYIKTL